MPPTPEQFDRLQRAARDYITAIMNRRRHHELFGGFNWQEPVGSRERRADEEIRRQHQHLTKRVDEATEELVTVALEIALTGEDQ